MCNTWRNVFLQSMKNNTLSVKKLTKNLILGTLRQLYAVSEKHHSYTVGHATTKSWISSVVHILQLCIVFTFSVVFLHWLYIYMSLCPLHHSVIAISSSWFSAKWMWSDPSPLCNTQPNLFTNSSYAFYLKLVQNLHSVLVSWRICERNF